MSMNNNKGVLFTYLCNMNEQLDRFAIIESLDRRILLESLQILGNWGGTMLDTGQQDSSWVVRVEDRERFHTILYSILGPEIMNDPSRVQITDVTRSPIDSLRDLV